MASTSVSVTLSGTSATVGKVQQAATFAVGATLAKAQNITVQAALSGPQGATGATGAASTVAGPAGANGIQGIQGVQGIIGLTGLTGGIGSTGSTGVTGPAGPANSLSIGTVSTGAAAASITGTAPSQVLNLTLQTGTTGTTGLTGPASTVAGPTGPAGPAGPANSLAIGTVSTGTAAATITGTAPTQTLNLVVPQGTNGTNGTAATIAVGTVTTGAAGSAATVTNVGSTAAAVFNMSIPQGVAGSAGAGTGDALVANPLSQFAPTTSLQLKNTISDETGSGALVFATSPALVTPTGIVKADVGLGNVPNTDATARANHSGTQLASTISDLATAVGATASVTANTAKVTNATHTGDVAGATALTIANNAVTNAKAAQMATKTYKGRTTAATGDAEDIPVATLKTDLALVKADVGLGSVDNTSDVGKPVSTATQTALNLKAPIASPTFTGTVGGVTAAMVGAPSGSGTSSGTNTGDQTSVSGNAGTVTTNANLTGDVTSVGNATTITGLAQSKVATLVTDLAAKQPNLTLTTTGTTGASTLVGATLNIPSYAGGGGGGISWTNVTGTTQTALINNGYIANNVALVTVTLPTTAVVGSIVEVAGSGAGGWKVAQVAGQTIRFGSMPTTAGITGSLASSNQYDAVRLLCITADTTYSVISSQGNVVVV